MKQGPDFAQVQIEGVRQDADEISEVISRLYVPTLIEPMPGIGRVRMSSAHGALPGIRLSRTEAPDGMRVLPQDPYDAIGFMAPFSGHIESHEERGIFSADASGAIAIDGLTCRLLQYSGDFGNRGVGIDRMLIARRLSMLLDRPVPTEIVFASQTDGRTSRCGALGSLFACLTDPVFGSMLSGSPFTAAYIPGMVIDFLLETWPHTYSAEFRREPLPIAPRAVKLAIDFIEAHPLDAASAEEIARLCGVSLRSLQYGFRHFVGASIAEYQRRVRLQRALGPADEPRFRRGGGPALGVHQCRPVQPLLQGELRRFAGQAEAVLGTALSVVWPRCLSARPGL